MSHELKGQLIVVNEIQSFPSGFTKREFVLETIGDKYPQKIKFELKKDKCGLIDKYAIGTEITVHFDIDGNEYNGKYFVSLGAWKLDGNESSIGQRSQNQNTAPPPPLAAMNDALDDDSSIPF